MVMEDSPLNLAHFHERRAEKHLKYHRYDEALRCLEKSLYYIEEAYKTIKMPKAIQVLNVQEREYKRQIRQIQFKSANYECTKTTDETSNDSNQCSEEFNEQTLKDSDQVLLAVDKTMKEYDARFVLDDSNTENTLYNKDHDDEKLLVEMALKVKKIPNLAPLELPSFDYKLFHRVQSENFDCTSKLDEIDILGKSKSVEKTGDI